MTQPRLMRQSDITAIHNTRRRAGKGMIVSIAAIAFSIMLLEGTLYEPEHVAIGMDQYWAVIKWTLIVFGVLFAGGWLAAIINGIIFLRAGRDRSQPAVVIEDTDGTSDTLRFDSEQRITDGRIEDRSEPNSIGLGRVDLSRNEWRKLAGVLAAANWRWSRRLLEKTNIWEGLTAMHGNRTKYEIVTSDFEKVRAVKVTRGRDGKITKARTTPAGREAICQLAGTALL